NEFLRYDPADPSWPGRDRFVLSCGHASMLLYSVLHLAGVKKLVDGRPVDELAVTLDDIRRFRQLGSRCFGHPEHFETSGVETTTGPLGKASATASAWRLRSAGWPRTSIGLGSNYSTTTFLPYAAMAI